MVGAQKYDAAVPLLTELVTRLGESTDPQLQSKVEGFRYFLGLGHVFTDQWEAAAQVFESFLKAHPKSNRYRKVLELHGDTLVQSKRYPEAAEEYKKLLEMKLPETENFPIMEKLASCYMRDQKWAEAIPVLQTLSVSCPTVPAQTVPKATPDGTTMFPPSETLKKNGSIEPETTVVPSRARSWFVAKFAFRWYTTPAGKLALAGVLNAEKTPKKFLPTAIRLE